MPISGSIDNGLLSVWNKQKRRTLLIYCCCDEWVNTSYQILLLRILFPVLYSLEEAAVGALESRALWDSTVLKHRGGLIGTQWMAITIYHKPHAQAELLLPRLSCPDVRALVSHLIRRQILTCLHRRKRWTAAFTSHRRKSKFAFEHTQTSVHEDSEEKTPMAVHRLLSGCEFTLPAQQTGPHVILLALKGRGKRCLQGTQPLREYRIWLMPFSFC